MSKPVKESVALSTGAAVSSVLVGRFDHALDPKKRLTIPSEWRAAMGNPQYVYVMPDRAEKCLDLVPQAEMEMRLEKLREKALFDPSLNKALQVLGSVSEQLALDVQGRIRIGDRLLKYANLSGVVAMKGAVRMIKLWDLKAIESEETIDIAALDAALDKLQF